jgi:hypothetical protein
MAHHVRFNVVLQDVFLAGTTGPLVTIERIPLEKKIRRMKLVGNRSKALREEDDFQNFSLND